MFVQFPSGESFEGPWEDDESVSDDTTVFRRLRSDWIEAVPDGEPRVKSSAFQPHPRSNSISVTLEDTAIDLDVDPHSMALGDVAHEYGLAAFTVGDARHLGFLVRRVPLSVDPGHAMLFVSEPTSGECPHKNRCRKLGQQLARLAQIAIVPPEA